MVETSTRVEDSIETLTKQLIFNEIEHEKPFSMGEFLQLAQATLYIYLKEIKQSKYLDIDSSNFERELS